MPAALQRRENFKSLFTVIGKRCWLTQASPPPKLAAKPTATHVALWTRALLG